MKEELIADIWNVFLEHVPDKHRKDAAIEYITILQDHGIRDNILESTVGVDSYLDAAILHAVDDDDDDDDDDY